MSSSPTVLRPRAPRSSSARSAGDTKWAFVSPVSIRISALTPERIEASAFSTSTSRRNVRVWGSAFAPTKVTVPVRVSPVMNVTLAGSPVTIRETDCWATRARTVRGELSTVRATETPLATNSPELTVNSSRRPANGARITVSSSASSASTSCASAAASAALALESRSSVLIPRSTSSRTLRYSRSARSTSASARRTRASGPLASRRAMTSPASTVTPFSTGTSTTLPDISASTSVSRSGVACPSTIRTSATLPATEVMTATCTGDVATSVMGAAASSCPSIPLENQPTASSTITTAIHVDLEDPGSSLKVSRSAFPSVSVSSCCDTLHPRSMPALSLNPATLTPVLRPRSPASSVDRRKRRGRNRQAAAGRVGECGEQRRNRWPCNSSELRCSCRAGVGSFGRGSTSRAAHARCRLPIPRSAATRAASAPDETGRPRGGRVRAGTGARSSGIKPAPRLGMISRSPACPLYLVVNLGHVPEVAVWLEGCTESPDEHAQRGGKRGHLHPERGEASARDADPPLEQCVAEEAVRHEPGDGEEAEIGHQHSQSHRDDGTGVADGPLLAERASPGCQEALDLQQIGARGRQRDQGEKRDGAERKTGCDLPGLCGHDEDSQRRPRRRRQATQAKREAPRPHPEDCARQRAPVQPERTGVETRLALTRRLHLLDTKVRHVLHPVRQIGECLVPEPAHPVEVIGRAEPPHPCVRAICREPVELPEEVHRQSVKAIGGPPRVEVCIRQKRGRQNRGRENARGHPEHARPLPPVQLSGCHDEGEIPPAHVAVDLGGVEKPHRLDPAAIGFGRSLQRLDHPVETRHAVRQGVFHGHGGRLRGIALRAGHVALENPSDLDLGAVAVPCGRNALFICRRWRGHGSGPRRKAHCDAQRGLSDRDRGLVEGGDDPDRAGHGRHLEPRGGAQRPAERVERNRRKVHVLLPGVPVHVRRLAGGRLYGQAFAHEPGSSHNARSRDAVAGDPDGRSMGAAFNRNDRIGFSYQAWHIDRYCHEISLFSQRPVLSSEGYSR